MCFKASNLEAKLVHEEKFFKWENTYQKGSGSSSSSSIGCEKRITVAALSSQFFTVSFWQRRSDISNLPWLLSSPNWKALRDLSWLANNWDN